MCAVCHTQLQEKNGIMVTFIPLVIPLLATVGVCLILGMAALRRHGIPGARSFFTLMVCLSTYAFGYACELSSRTAASAMFWVRVEDVGIALVPLVLCRFALQVGGRARPAILSTSLLTALSGFFILVVWTNSWHHLLWRSVTVRSGTGPWEPLILEKTYGPLLLLFSLYVFVACGVEIVFLISGLRRTAYYTNGQMYAVLIAAAAPMTGNVLFQLAPASLPHLDWGALALSISAVALFWAVFQYGLFNIAPLANRLLVRQMADAIIVLDTEGRIIQLNPSAEAILGTSFRAAQGTAGRDLLQKWPELSAWVATEREGTLEIGGPPWFDAKLSLLRAHRGTIIGLLLVLRDVTDRKRLEEQLHYMAQHDLLTGLPNRMLLDDRMAQMLKLAARSGSGVGLLYIDLDHFKEINDTQGHQAGDRYLVAIAQRLLACVRGADTVARVGGDEFVVLLSGCSSAHSAAIVARKIVDALGEPVGLDGSVVPCTASVGLAWSCQDGSDPSLLLHYADAAMYRAKARGGDAWQAWNSKLIAEDISSGSDGT